MSILISVDSLIRDNKLWRELVGCCARNGELFEIQCWRNEKEQIALLEKFAWQTRQTNGELVTFQGVITADFISFLTSGKKPRDSQGYVKYTPYFIVKLGKNFSSEQYGAEILISYPDQEKKKNLQKIINNVGRGVRVCRNI